MFLIYKIEEGKDDLTLLKALLDNEKDTNKAYEEMNDRDDLCPQERTLVWEGLKNEKNHKQWFKENL